jgi:hypothetical protein
MTDSERKQADEALANGRKVIVLDRSGQKPKPVREPIKKLPDKSSLSRKSRRRLDARKRRRVNEEARKIGYMVFRDATPVAQKRIRDLEAIMRDAKLKTGDNASVRQFYRALVDGIVEAVHTLPEQEIKPTKAKRVRRKKGD